MNTSKCHADNLKSLPYIRNISINIVIQGVILFGGYHCENIESHTRNEYDF